MWSVMVVEVLEGVDVLGDGVDVLGKVAGCVELVSPGAVASFDGAVELWGVGGQDIEKGCFCRGRPARTRP